MIQDTGGESPCDSHQPPLSDGRGGNSPFQALSRQYTKTSQIKATSSAGNSPTDSGQRVLTSRPASGGNLRQTRKLANSSVTNFASLKSTASPSTLGEHGNG